MPLKLRLRHVTESDRPRIENQLANDRRDMLANTAQLDFVNKMINDLERRRVTSSPHIESEAISCEIAGCVYMTIASAITHHEKQKTALEKQKIGLDAIYNAHCVPRNELNRRRRLVEKQEQAAALALAISESSEATPQRDRRLSLAW